MRVAGNSFRKVGIPPTDKRKDYMNDKQINEYLRESLKAYMILKKNGEEELALRLLSYSSAFAEYMITIGGILGTVRPRYKNPQTHCSRGHLLSPQEKNADVCLVCDHLDEAESYNSEKEEQ